MTLDEARKQLAEAEDAWSARPWDPKLQQQLREARAQLARVHQQSEQRGQLTLGDAQDETP